MLTSPMRPYIVAASLCLASLSLSSVRAELKSATTETTLIIEDFGSIPLREISGVSLHEKLLYLASDNSRNFLRIPLNGTSSKDLDLSKASEIKLKEDADDQSDGGQKRKKAKKNKKSQWEGLAMDKPGSIFAIQESKDQIFQFTNDGQLKRSYQLTTFDHRTSKSKGYEGLLLLKKSHILVALSKDTTLIEFGPKGDAPLGLSQTTVLTGEETFTDPSSDDLFPLAHWKLEAPGSCQFSDLALGSDGKALALLKSCSKIIRIPELEASKNVFTPTQSYSYPDELDHAEGLLAATPKGFLVTNDQDSEKKNIFWLVPKPETTKP